LKGSSKLLILKHQHGKLSQYEEQEQEGKSAKTVPTTIYVIKFFHKKKVEKTPTVEIKSISEGRRRTGLEEGKILKDTTP